MKQTKEVNIWKTVTIVLAIFCLVSLVGLIYDKYFQVYTIQEGNVIFQISKTNFDKLTATIPVGSLAKIVDTVHNSSIIDSRIS